MPKVSIITVAFNSAATIGDTLRSVADQTHADIEHIVVDGGSRDGTVDIVRQFGHVARCISERDRGIYDAMNKGLRLATGELIGFLNADDIFASPDSVAALVRAAQKTNSDAVYGDLVYVQPFDLESVVRVWRSGVFSKRQLRMGWMPPHPTFYIRRRVLQCVSSFDDRLRIAADYDFVLRCLSRPGATASRVPQVLVRMRTGGASNHSLTALWRKSNEDLLALRRSGVGGLFTLFLKNMRKIPQFFLSERLERMNASRNP
jgi:glycosyltransferase